MIPLAVGDRFSASMQPVAQPQINQFGALLGTHGPIHTDPEFAKTTFLKGVVVQGGVLLAPVHDFMCQLVGEDRWLRHGWMEAKIVSYTRPEDATRYELQVEALDDKELKLSVACTKDADTKVMVASITVGLAGD